MSNYIFWHCALDERFSPEDSGLFVFSVLSGDISAYKSKIGRMREIYESDDNIDNEDLWIPNSGEVGWKCCTKLNEGEYLVAMYDNFGDQGQVVLSFDSNSEITLEKVKNYLKEHSYDNDECRGRPCREGNAFYSFIVDWRGNVIYRPPTIEYPEDILFEENISPLSWKLHDAIDLGFEGYSKCSGKKYFSRENINILTDDFLSKSSITKTLLCLRKYDLGCLPTDIFKIIYYMVLDYNQKHFEIFYHDPILPSFRLCWENARIGNKRSFYWENIMGDNEKMRLDAWITEESSYSRYSLKYLCCDITILPKQNNKSKKFLVVSISSTSTSDPYSTIRFDKNNFRKRHKNDVPIQVSFKACIYSPIENKDISINFYVYYNY